MTAVYLLEPKKTTPAGAEAEEKEGTWNKI
jgi:hypothetical protein